MPLWLLDQNILHAIENAPALTQAQTDLAVAAIGGVGAQADRVMVVSGNSATINVQGVMTSQPSFMAYYFGGGNTLYGDLEAAINAAESDPNIKTVDFAFSSGGGEAQPVAAIGDMIADMKKPTTAVVNTAGSAAYWLASQCSTIVAENRASRFGSIGAATMARKPSESSVIEIASTNAPNKRPDPETEEGMAAIRVELDQFHDLFATAVAVGRDKTVETVNNTFGQGGMMLAGQALEVGMIDRIGRQPSKKSQATTTGAKTMDLATLKADHPALHQAVLDEGIKIGAAAELDRVKYHALMGQKTGAQAFALNACLTGVGKDNTEAQVEYMTFGRDNADIGARASDEADLSDNSPASADEGVREAAAVANIFDRVGA